jgi:hypothetical protein
MAVATPLGAAGEAARIAGAALERAALVHRFDPLDFIPASAGPAVEAQALALVARDSTEADPSDRTATESAEILWRLTPEARRRELRKLVAEARLETALEQAGARDDDSFAEYLHSALRGEMNPASIDPTQRESAAAAARFAAEVVDRDRAAKIDDALRELQTSLSQSAAEERTSGLLSGRLEGFEDETAALEAFAATGAIRPSDLLPAPDLHAVEIAAFLVEAPSGSGKSALLADIVRRWRGYRLHAPTLPAGADMRQTTAFASNFVRTLMDRAWFAALGLVKKLLGRAESRHILVLDLDRSALAIGGEIAWTAEVTRQIGLAEPALGKRLGDLREEIRQNRMLLDASGKHVTALFAASADLERGLAEALEAELPPSPVLIILLDSFEEAVGRSFPVGGEGIAETMFGRVMRWADSFDCLTTASGAPLFGAVRVIAAGRESPSLEDVRLARWFAARLRMRPVAEPEIRAGSEAHSLALYRRVGPLRLHADDVARLPANEREAARLARSGYARRQGHLLSDTRFGSDGAEGSEDRESTAAIGKSPDELFAFLREPKISIEIDTAFIFADFAAAAGIGWRRIGTIAEFPDLSEPWRLPGDPISHWIWQAALAALAVEEIAPVRSRLEYFTSAFAHRLDPSRAGTDATGLVLAAATTIALDGRLPPEVREATEALAAMAEELRTVRTFADLRLLALYPSWRARHEVLQRRVRIPYRRLRLFSQSLLAPADPALEIEGLDRLAAFVADARIETPTAREIDKFTSSDGKQIEVLLTAAEAQSSRLADILVGLSPELYDTLVMALIETDRTTREAVDFAIEATRDLAPFWPRDLAPEQIPSRAHERRAGAIARTVVHADRCGLLRNLLESVVEKIETVPLRNVTRLVQRYEDLRRTAFTGEIRG